MGLVVLGSVFGCGERALENPEVASDKVLTSAMQGTWVTDCHQTDYEGKDADMAPLFDESSLPRAVNYRIAVSGERMTLLRTFHSSLECSSRMITVEDKGRFLLPKTTIHSPKSIRVTWERRFFSLFASLPLEWSTARVCGKREWIPGDRVEVTDMACGERLGYSAASTWEYAFNLVTGALYLDGQTYFRQ